MSRTVGANLCREYAIIVNGAMYDKSFCSKAAAVEKAASLKTHNVKVLEVLTIESLIWSRS